MIGTAIKIFKKSKKFRNKQGKSPDPHKMALKYRADMKKRRMDKRMTRRSGRTAIQLPVNIPSPIGMPITTIKPEQNKILIGSIIGIAIIGIYFIYKKR